MVEFAFILPLLLLLTFGIIEFGFYVYNQQIITNAAREAARVGIVATQPRVPDVGTGSIESVAQNYCSNYLVSFGTSSPPTTSVSGYAPNAAPFSDLSVTVRYQYLFPLLPDTDRPVQVDDHAGGGGYEIRITRPFL